MPNTRSNWPCRAAAAIAFGLMAALTAGVADAGVVYQSASYTGQDTGEYIIDDDNIMGAVFTVTQKTNVTAIGGQFGGYPSGDIFGAILPVDPATGVPPGSTADLAAIDIAHVTFAVPTVTAVDLVVPLSVTLNPGTYALAFGTDQFGATGYAGMGDLNNPVGSPDLIRSFFSTDWEAFDDTGVRFVVYSAAVPEPAAWAMMLIGFGAVGGVMRAKACNTRKAPDAA
jgi:hypothetical protein